MKLINKILLILFAMVTSINLFSINNKSIFIPSDTPNIVGRNITIVFPPNYNSKRTYKTIYMHDGQNTFNFDPYGHGGWQADKTVEKLINEGQIEPIIIILIPNNGVKREYEYTNEESGANNYLSYITKNIIPYIEENYPVSQKKEDRIICGSSYGGIISLVAGWNYSSIFGNVISMSPSLQIHWVTNLVSKNKNPGIKLYIDTGNLEDPGNTTNKFYSKLLKNGFTENVDIKYIYGIGHDHNERAWRERLPEALLFILSKDL